MTEQTTNPSADEELNALLTPEANASDNGLDFLDNLLAESVQQATDRKESKALLSRIRQGKASEAEKAQAGAVELKASWLPVAVCEMWEQASCECGHVHSYFTQYMVEYRPAYHTMGGNSRWLRTEAEHLPDGLPQKAIMNNTDVHYCSHCSEPSEGVEVIVWQNGRTLSEEFGENA